MLVLAPAACIISGIALGEVFGLLTKSLKYKVHSEVIGDVPKEKKEEKVIVL